MAKLATPPRLYLFRLGPIDVGGRASWLVAGVNGKGDLVSPQVERSQSKALSAIVKQHPGKTFRCEPGQTVVLQPATAAIKVFSLAAGKPAHRALGEGRLPLRFDLSRSMEG